MGSGGFTSGRCGFARSQASKSRQMPRTLVSRERPRTGLPSTCERTCRVNKKDPPHRVVELRRDGPSPKWALLDSNQRPPACKAPFKRAGFHRFGEDLGISPPIRRRLRSEVRRIGETQHVEKHGEVTSWVPIPTATDSNPRADRPLARIRNQGIRRDLNSRPFARRARRTSW
jgi:hypothetical protein